jgi:predicted DNA-binding transcriptional regulator AlpA
VEPIYTTDELAQRLRQSAATLRYWRYIGYGPKAIRMGRRVVYAESEVLRWLAELKARR